MAADRASQSNACAFCGAEHLNFVARHVCPGCGRPQPLSRSEDYFSALGVTRKFNQSPAELEKRFYEASRALHPDRFSTADAGAKAASLERMSFLNEAYRTLKSPSLLRQYMLTLEGVVLQKDQKGQIPAELAESWFELQDALMESPEDAKKRLVDLESELERLKKREAEAIGSIEASVDRDPTQAKALLPRMAQMIQKQSYLASMERDIERIKGRLAG